MNKYCTNCGKELNLECDYCLNCGKIIVKNKNVIKSESKKKNISVLGIIGFISGLLAFYLSFLFAIFTNNILYEINDILRGMNENIILYKLFFSLFYSLIPLVPSITGLVMSYISAKKDKNIYAIIGLVGSLISLVFCVCMVVYLIM